MSDEQTLYTDIILQLEETAQKSIHDFATHDVSDLEGLEKKRKKMHEDFFNIYSKILDLIRIVRSEIQFDIDFTSKRFSFTKNEQEQSQIKQALEKLKIEYSNNLSIEWRFRVFAWAHKHATTKGIFIDELNEDAQKESIRLLSDLYNMLDLPFSTIVSKTDGAQKLRQVAITYKVKSLLEANKAADDKEISDIVTKNYISEGEFYDDYLNELLEDESILRGAFNPYDDILWKDILSIFAYEEAMKKYENAINSLENSAQFGKREQELVKQWKTNVEGLIHIYKAALYSDIANIQIEIGNYSNAGLMFKKSAEEFNNAKEVFKREPQLKDNAERAQKDGEGIFAEGLLAEAVSYEKDFEKAIQEGDREKANELIDKILKNLDEAGNLNSSSEISRAIEEDKRTYTFIKDMIKNTEQDIKSIKQQLDFARGLRKTGLIQTIESLIKDTEKDMERNPSEALNSIKKALKNLGLLEIMVPDDEKTKLLSNHIQALSNHVKYLIQYEISSKVSSQIIFVISRIIEYLTLKDAAKYYRKIKNTDKAEQLEDFANLALSTAYTTEANIFLKNSEQSTFNARVIREQTMEELKDIDKVNITQEKITSILSEAEKLHDAVIESATKCLMAFKKTAEQLKKIKTEKIKQQNNTEIQLQQLEIYMIKLEADINRFNAAKEILIGEVYAKKKDLLKAGRYFSKATDYLRTASQMYGNSANKLSMIGQGKLAESIAAKAQSANFLSRITWDNRQKAQQQQKIRFFSDVELNELYEGFGL